MSENFLALSFDCAVSPGVELHGDEQSSELFSSWGFAWYPTGENVASVFKGGSETPKDLITQTLSDWKRFQSTSFICHFSNINYSHDHKNIQPFTKNMAGRDWTWLSIGEIEKTGHEGDSSFTESLGTTGAEESFCILLDYFNSNGYRALSEVNYDLLYKFFNEKDRFVKTDLIVSDGQNILVYRGCESEKNVYVSRMLPPHSYSEISCEFTTIDICGALDGHRTIIAISTTPLEVDNQRIIEPGGMISICRATITWESKVKQTSDAVHNPISSESNQPSTAPLISQQNKKITTNIRSITSTEEGIALSYRSLKVYHKTTYKYTKLVRRSTHLFRLSPVEDEVQEVEKASVMFSVANKPLFFEDSFGNRVAHLTVEEPYKTFSIVSEAKVKIYALPPDNFDSPLRRAQIPLLWMPWQRQMMLPYLLPPELPESELAELSEYAMSFVERNDYQLLPTLEDINKTIYADYKYQSDSSLISSSAFDVYVNRKGVCQDFSNLLICLARILSIPARYRMGYIFTGGDYENKVQSDASHAWVEAYLPYIGWRGYDPTNGCQIKQDHIRIACGRNYIDATPTSGTIYKGGGEETLSIEVKVEDNNEQIN